MNMLERRVAFEKIHKEIMNLQHVKGGEYAVDADGLANFREEAKDNGLNMETILRVFANKHWRAISRFISDKQHGLTRPASEGIEGRINDMITYLMILRCILDEGKIENVLKPAYHMDAYAKEIEGLPGYRPVDTTNGAHNHPHKELWQSSLVNHDTLQKDGQPFKPVDFNQA